MKYTQIFLILGLIGCSGSSGWHFDRPPSTLVTTQRLIVQKKQPILYVIHDNDGDWQFLADGMAQQDPVVQVTLRDLIAIDSTIADLAYLKKGWKAWRTSGTAPWNTEIYR